MRRLSDAIDRLPRDARDTLFQLLVIAWTLLPHLSHLPVWCGLLAGAMLLWRARLAVKAEPLPSRLVVAGVLLVAGVLTWTGERTLLGKEAGVTLLVVLMTLKTLELRARRDALVVFFLGFFIVLTNFLYSQTLLVALSMLLSVWGLLTALVLAHMPVGRPPLARAGRLAARAALLGAPLMVVLFVLFPRIGPLWGVPSDAAGRTGLSGTMRLGGLATLANDDAIALRVRFEGPAPPQQQMYFRGPVLGSFNGTDWTRLQPQMPPRLRLRAEPRTAGQPVPYEMTLEPSRLPMLPLLELTPDRPGEAPQVDGWQLTQGSDLQWLTDRPVNERLRFTATAWPVYRHGPAAPLPGLRDWVTLPPGFNPRTLQWAADLRARPEYREAGTRVLAAAVLAHIRNGGYTYTLEPGGYGRDAVDEFWLDRKLGFCEHFAAAFVVVMRALDVPARVVTGYQGSDAQPSDGWWVVRQSNAHAWAEVWAEGEGWLRVDPTAAVAPDRVRLGRSLPPRPPLVAGVIASVNPQLMAELRANWEALNNRWNQWVLNYSRQQQFSLLQNLGVESPDWRTLSNLLVGLLAATALAGAGWAWWDRRRQDPWQRLQLRIAQRLAALGVNVAEHHPPRERARRVRDALGARGEALARELEALDLARYGPGGQKLPARAWWPAFRAAARAAASR